VRFRTGKADRELVGLLARLAMSHVDLTQFREIPTDLEDAFLSVTNSLRDQQTPTGVAS